MAVQLTNEMIKSAQNTETKTGVPASITLGQIMLESGGLYSGGLSGLAYKYNNLFGVHARQGEKSVTLKENATGKEINYKVYGSISEAVDDHARILSLDRYASRYENAQSIEDYAKALQEGGYAIDPNYASKLVNTINNNNLTQYDIGLYKYKKTEGDSASSSDNLVSNTDDLKWYGDILRFITILGVAIICVVFTLKSLSINTDIKQKVKKAVKKRKSVSEKETEAKETEAKEESGNE